MKKSTTYLYLMVVSFLFQSGISYGQLRPIQDKLMSGTNLIDHLKNENLKGFSWLNKPESYALTEGKLSILAPSESDFFNNPEDGKVTGTAPFLYTEVEGDFVAIAKVQPDFSAMWNAAALMVYWDSQYWIKFAFENSDATGPGIVSVVTREVSDDANGVILDASNAIWLKLVRKGNLYSMLWSGDGKIYKMARLAAMPEKKIIKVGIEAQCPVGSDATHQFSHFSLEDKTVSDVRKGE